MGGRKEQTLTADLILFVVVVVVMQLGPRATLLDLKMQLILGLKASLFISKFAPNSSSHSRRFLAPYSLMI